MVATNNSKDPAEKTVKIAGKKVTLRQEFTLEDGADIIGLAMAADTRDYKTCLPLFKKMVANWEFEGDPATDDGYVGKGVFGVLAPLYIEIDALIASQIKKSRENSKN
jgi:hypothetical protein